MRNDTKSGGRRGRSEGKTWPAIERRLSDLFESSPPHVRQNLATLAAVLADEPAALDALARIAAEAANEVAHKRGQSDDVLRSVFAERDRLKPGQRDRFDERLKVKLGKKWPQWDIGPAVDALLRLGFPAGALPAEAFARAIIEEAGHFTPGDRDEGDTSIRARVRDHLRRFSQAEAGADPTWRRAVRAALFDQFGKMSRRDRGIVYLALLRVWPDLIASDNGFGDKPLASARDLNYAASLGRGGAWGRIWKAVSGAAAAAGLIVALIFATLLILGLPFESRGGVPTSIITEGLTSFAILVIFGTSVGLVVSFLYVPTAGRQVRGLMLLRQLLLPAVAGAAVTALFAWWATSLFGFRDGDKILVPVFVATVIALATMLRTVHDVSLRPRADLPERQDAWYIALVSAPAILLSLTVALTVHVSGGPGAGLFALLITIAVAGASGVWSVEEANQPTGRWQGIGTGTRAYRLAKTAAAMVAVLALITLPLAFQAKKQAEGVPVTAAEIGARRVSVPTGRPFVLNARVDTPFRVTPQHQLLVRLDSEWKKDFPADIRLANRLFCLDCARFPEFSDWLAMFLRSPGNREGSRMDLALVPAVRPREDAVLPEAPVQPLAIAAGAPVRVTVRFGRHGFRLENSAAGYIVTGVDGTHFSSRRPATPTDPVGGLISTTNIEDPGTMPPLFALEPGTYRICIFLHPQDEATCRPGQARMRQWVRYPGEVRMSIAPEALSGAG